MIGTAERSWRIRASCLDQDPELFFPDGEEGHGPLRQLEHARQVCTVCPVRAACLAAALENDVQHGMWGGATPEERRRMKRRKQITAGAGSPYLRSLNFATVE